MASNRRSISQVRANLEKTKPKNVNLIDHIESVLNTPNHRYNNVQLLTLQHHLEEKKRNAFVNSVRQRDNFKQFAKKNPAVVDKNAAGIVRNSLEHFNKDSLKNRSVLEKQYANLKKKAKNESNIVSIQEEYRRVKDQHDMADDQQFMNYVNSINSTLNNNQKNKMYSVFPHMGAKIEEFGIARNLREMEKGRKKGNVRLTPRDVVATLLQQPEDPSRDKYTLQVLHDKLTFGEMMKLENKLASVEKKMTNAKKTKKWPVLKAEYKDLMDQLEVLRGDEESGSNTESNTESNTNESNMKQLSPNNIKKLLQMSNQNFYALAAKHVPEKDLMNLKLKNAGRVEIEVKNIIQNIKQLLHDYEHFEIEQYRNQKYETEYMSGLYKDLREIKESVPTAAEGEKLPFPIHNLTDKYRKNIPKNLNQRRMIQGQIQAFRLSTMLDSNLERLYKTLERLRGHAEERRVAPSVEEGFINEYKSLKNRKIEIDKEFKKNLRGFMNNKEIVKYKLGPERDLYTDVLDAYIEHNEKDYDDHKRAKTLRAMRTHAAEYKKKMGYHGLNWLPVKTRYLAEYVRHPIDDGGELHYPLSRKYHNYPVLRI